MKRRDTITAEFKSELQRRSIEIVAARPDDLYVLRILGTDSTVSLANLRKNIERDHDLSAVSRFVDGLLTTRLELPPWPEVASGIRYSAEPSSHDFANTIHDSITRAMSRVIAYTDPAESRISWLSETHCSRWGVGRNALNRAACTNMDALLRQAKLEIDTVANSRIGLFSIDSVFKASLIFSPSLKAFVKALGWPILIVAPARDFLYAFTDERLIPRLASVVTREFTNSGYPVTPEVLRISDNGIEALGAFGA